MLNYDGHSNRRKPDNMQWLLVWLMGLVAAGTGYQIIQNQANAVTRSQVQKIVEKQDSVPQKWQIDQINQQLEAIRQDQQNIHRTLQRKIPERRP